MPQCPDCGALNSESSSFCIRCGQTFAAATARPAAAEGAGAGAGRILDEAAESYAAGRLDDAAAACRAALDEDANHVAARSLLGMVEEDRGNLAAALAEYEAVIRLAPERTAERERADRLRAQVRAQAADTYADEPYDRRRIIALGVALAAGVLVLIIGSLAVSRGARTDPPSPAGLAGVPGEPGMPPLDETRADVGPGAEQHIAASLDVGDGPLSGHGIGPPADGPVDQSAVQPSRSPARGQAPPIPDPLPLPPPTVDRSPLQLPQPQPQPQPEAAPVPLPAPSPPASAPSMEPARGQVRIWMGDDVAPQSVGPSAEAPAATPTGAARPEAEQRQARHVDRSAAPARSARPTAGEARGAPADDGTGALRPPARAPTTGAQPATRTGVGTTRPETSRPRPLTTTSGSGAADPRRPTGGLPSQPEGVSPRPYGGSAPAPATSAPRPGAPSAPTAAPAAPSAPSTSAADLRARAQQAAAAGRRDEARGLYRNAIQTYQSEARANPGRAAANRSAIESCERALDALDVSR